MSKKIGIGMVTYNAPDRIKKSSFTVPSGVDKFVIVNDGTGHLYSSDCYPKAAEVICHLRNLSVGCAKNTALRTLIQAGCDYLFLMEDDILITNPNVFEAYIKASEKSGCWHMNYGYHGPANLTPDGKPNPRQVIDYGDGVELAFNQHCVGAFSTYTKGMIRHVGYNDERFKNAFEHVEHTMRIIKAGLAPAFWWFPDLSTSNDYLKEIASSTVSTVIPHTEEWQRNFQISAHLFRHLHGNYPTQVPDTTPEEIINRLNEIQKNYAIKK
jgi:GT2 family glycosyltransferase